jgi:hypothetical protein
MRHVQQQRQGGRASSNAVPHCSCSSEQCTACWCSAAVPQCQPIRRLQQPASLSSGPHAQLQRAWLCGVPCAVAVARWRGLKHPYACRCGRQGVAPCVGSAALAVKHGTAGPQSRMVGSSMLCLGGCLAAHTSTCADHAEPVGFGSLPLAVSYALVVTAGSAQGGCNGASLVFSCHAAPQVSAAAGLFWQLGAWNLTISCCSVASIPGNGCCRHLCSQLPLKPAGLCTLHSSTCESGPLKAARCAAHASTQHEVPSTA